MRLISSKQNAAKHKSCDLRCYCEQTGYAKHRLSKFKEIFSNVATVATAGKLSKENFLLHFKECEFRYNNSKDTKQAKRSRSDVCIKELYHIVLKLIRGLIGSNASRS